MKRIFNTVFLFLFLVLFANNVFAKKQKSSVRNCSNQQAEIFFKDKSIVLNYNKSYYCSDILYLQQNKKGNISLGDYKNLYPTEFHSNFDYFRKMGFTPNIVKKYIKKEMYNTFSNKESIDAYIKGLILLTRQIHNYYIIVDKTYEHLLQKKEDDDIYEKGDILNKETYYKSCLVKNKKRLKNVFSNLPVALIPVVINGNKLLNMFGDEIGFIKNNPFDLKQKKIIFKNGYLENESSFDIAWHNETCDLKNNLQKRVDILSRCVVCSMIVMFSNLISFIFQSMFNNFKWDIIIFWGVIGCLWILFEFLKGFKGVPFDVDMKSFPKSVSKKMQILFTVSVLILVPVPQLFSWTVAPVMDLTLGISHMIMDIGSKQENKFYCDINKSVKDVMVSFKNENPLPPVISKYQNSAITLTSITDDEKMIFNNDIMGSIVCFLKKILTHNAKYIVMGSVLMKDSLLGFIPNIFSYKLLIGFMIFGLFIIINLRISFYILDALFDFLKLAITWPFAVFGMVFNVIGFSTSINSLVGMAKKFGLIMINLSVFSLYNSILINSFSINNNDSNTNISNIVNQAIETGDTTLITENVFTDILSVSKFLFIVYCLYYIYSQLGKFAGFYGGNSGDIKVEKSMEEIVKTTLKQSTTPPKRSEKQEKLKKQVKKK